MKHAHLRPPWLWQTRVYTAVSAVKSPTRFLEEPQFIRGSASPAYRATTASRCRLRVLTTTWEMALDAISLLKDDHTLMRSLLGELEATTARAIKKRTTLLRKIEANLTTHTTVEEEIFYPAFREAGEKSDDEKMYFEALEEHRAAGELVLPDLLGTDPSSEKFSGRAKVLKELVEHHADEEEKDMFPRAKKLLTRTELGELGERMAARRKELLN